MRFANFAILLLIAGAFYGMVALVNPEHALAQVSLFTLVWKTLAGALTLGLLVSFLVVSVITLCVWVIMCIHAVKPLTNYREDIQAWKIARWWSAFMAAVLASGVVLFLPVEAINVVFTLNRWPTVFEGGAVFLASASLLLTLWLWNFVVEIIHGKYDQQIFPVA